MTLHPVHTPYDGRAKPFTIGLKPIPAARWIETHPDLEALLAEKKHLEATSLDAVFAQEPDTEEAQAEVLALLAEHLLAHHGAGYSEVAGGIRVEKTGAVVPLGEAPEPALLRAGRLVADDLLLMRRSPEGWRLVAGSLSFPSSWSLAEKMGRPIHRIHEPVPGFGPGTRAAELIARMFDSMARGQVGERWNWSIQADRRLHLPASHTQRGLVPGSRFPGSDPLGSAFIRVERQTLAKLPRSGDILFTVRIHLDPLALIAAHPERGTLAPSLAAQLRGLSEAERDYKGLGADCDRLAAALDALA